MDPRFPERRVWPLLGAALALAGCSLQPSSHSSVIVDLSPLARGAQEQRAARLAAEGWDPTLARELGLVSPTADRVLASRVDAAAVLPQEPAGPGLMSFPSAPTSLADFDCVVLNVIGPGIASLSPGDPVRPPEQWDLNSVCSYIYPGVLSQPVDLKSGDTQIQLEVQVDRGPSRLVQVVGFMKDPTLRCDQIPLKESVGSAGGNAFQGQIGFFYELGKAKVDLFSDASVEISGGFDTNASIDNCHSQGGGGGGTGGGGPGAPGQGFLLVGGLKPLPMPTPTSTAGPMPVSSPVPTVAVNRFVPTPTGGYWDQQIPQLPSDLHPNFQYTGTQLVGLTDMGGATFGTGEAVVVGGLAWEVVAVGYAPTGTYKLAALMSPTPGSPPVWVTGEMFQTVHQVSPPITAQAPDKRIRPGVARIAPDQLVVYGGGAAAVPLQLIRRTSAGTFTVTEQATQVSPGVVYAPEAMSISATPPIAGAPAETCAIFWGGCSTLPQGPLCSAAASMPLQAYCWNGTQLTHLDFSAAATPRSGHTLTRLANGRLVALGGTGSGGGILPGFQVLDTSAGATWQISPEVTPNSTICQMALGRHGHSAVSLSGGKVLIFGGQGTSASVFLQDAWVVDIDALVANLSNSAACVNVSPTVSGLPPLSFAGGAAFSWLDTMPSPPMMFSFLMGGVVPGMSGVPQPSDSMWNLSIDPLNPVHLNVGFDSRMQGITLDSNGNFGPGPRGGFLPLRY